MSALKLSLLVISLVLVVLIPTSFTTVSADSGVSLSPSITNLNLLQGTPGSALGTIKWSGTFSTNRPWLSCKVSVPTTIFSSGLRPYVSSKSCSRTGANNVYIEIYFKFNGTYNGGTFNLVPTYTATLTLLGPNSTVVDRESISLEPVSIKQVSIQSIYLGNPAIDPNTVSYSVQPKPPVKVGQTLYIFTSADVNVVIQLSDTLSIPSTVQFQYYLASSNTGKQNYVSTDITIPAGKLTQQLIIPGMPLSQSIPFSVFYNNINIYSGTLDLASVAQQYSVGGATIVGNTPLLIWENEKVFTLNGSVFISDLQGTIQMTLYADGLPSKTITTTQPGTYVLSIPLPKRPNQSRGYYSIEYIGPYGSVGPIEITYEANFNLKVGGVLTDVFYVLFMSIFSAGFLAVSLGLAFRRPDLQSAGMLTMVAGVLIFFIPTLMGYSILLVTHAGVQDPIGLGDLTVFNLGNKVDRSVEYVQNRANYYSGLLYNMAIDVAAFIGTLGGIVVIGGWAGLVTGGALSQFLGRVLGSLGSQLLSLVSFSIIAATFLQILAAIFPIIIDVILVIMLFIALAQALFAAFTGNIAPVFSTVIGMSTLILTILLTPPILATMDYIKPQQTIPITIPHIKTFHVKNIFAELAIVVMEILIIAMILGMAFQRLMATLSGMGGG